MAASGPDDDVNLALLRPNEMVLPPAISQTVQDMAGSGGSGGDTHFHVNAMDARSFKEFLRHNSDTFGRQMEHRVRSGHVDLARAARGK